MTTPAAEEEWIEWRPDFAPHVLGRYTRRVADPRTGMAEEQKIEMFCEKCKGQWKTKCASGAVKRHISNFGAAHVHRDPFAPQKQGA